ncbi:hypothetical protein BKA70DRAFT_1222308 [Coprinopsis sp. MPI-PUGE-AT-0042]|nr:hypothetical protein BKA70DRAFT_1222308 [Coprinopsis sp. MPI-PUGE-AT-0042]
MSTPVSEVEDLSDPQRLRVEEVYRFFHPELDHGEEDDPPLDIQASDRLDVWYGFRIRVPAWVSPTALRARIESARLTEIEKRFIYASTMIEDLAWSAKRGVIPISEYRTDVGVVPGVGTVYHSHSARHLHEGLRPEDRVLCLDGSRPFYPTATERLLSRAAEFALFPSSLRAAAPHTVASAIIPSNKSSPRTPAPQPSTRIKPHDPWFRSSCPATPKLRQRSPSRLVPLTVNVVTKRLAETSVTASQGISLAASTLQIVAHNQALPQQMCLTFPQGLRQIIQECHFMPKFCTKGSLEETQAGKLYLSNPSAFVAQGEAGPNYAKKTEVGYHISARPSGCRTLRLGLQVHVLASYYRPGTTPSGWRSLRWYHGLCMSHISVIAARIFDERVIPTNHPVAANGCEPAAGSTFAVTRYDNNSSNKVQTRLMSELKTFDGIVTPDPMLENRDEIELQRRYQRKILDVQIAMGLQSDNQTFWKIKAAVVGVTRKLGCMARDATEHGKSGFPLKIELAAWWVREEVPITPDHQAFLEPISRLLSIRRDGIKEREGAYRERKGSTATVPDFNLILEAEELYDESPNLI